MTGTKADLILHPIRLRILTAFANNHKTAKEISELLPDIPQTTLYRHINLMVEGGLLRVVEEKPVRGTIERIYALSALPSLKSEDLQNMTKQECEQAFNIFLSTLMSDAQQYLNSKSENAKINPIDDGVEINKGMLYLTDDEFRRLNSKYQELMVEASRNQAKMGRKRRMFTYFFIPQE